MAEYLTYEMFGAVGDGVQDDMPSIVKTHEEANRLQMPVKAKAGAVYYISPANRTAVVHTSTDWTGAKFIVDDVDCQRMDAPVFHVASTQAPLPLAAEKLAYGQTKMENPFGKDLHVVVRNDRHMDYVRKGLNQDTGHPRTDVFVLNAKGEFSSPLSFDFDAVTSIAAYPVDEERLKLTGGEFITRANQAPARYTYHWRNIYITRSNVEAEGIRHRVTGEKEHGAPYRGFITVEDCARVYVHDCVFTGHFTYWTIGSAQLPVPMGSYDISLNRTANVLFARCTQTNDIHDDRYWGLIGTNFCRDLAFEDCHFSRFDAHMGVTNCTLRRCELGWQCLNAIGNGTFLIENTRAYGDAFVNLREDYGCTWRGKIIIRNSTWIPRGKKRAVFSGRNDGTHDFGYVCYMPDVEIDGLTVEEKETGEKGPLYVFNNYLGQMAPDAMQPHRPLPPGQVSVRNVCPVRPVLLCENPDLMPDTVYCME